MRVTDSRYGECLYFTSAALARKVEKLALASWKPVGLAPGHAYLLMSVLEEPGVQPSSLSATLHLQPSTITRFIEKLESKKLVIRSYEGKLTYVFPTPRAKALLPAMQRCMQDFYQQYAGLLGEEESRCLVEDMARIADKMDG